MTTTRSTTARVRFKISLLCLRDPHRIALYTITANIMSTATSILQGLLINPVILGKGLPSKQPGPETSGALGVGAFSLTGEGNDFVQVDTGIFVQD